MCAKKNEKIKDAKTAEKNMFLDILLLVYPSTI